MSSTPKLFQPAKVGDLELSNRVVFAPLTRFRADNAHVPTDMMVEYYKQRASYPGTLLITEATYITAQAGGMPNVPGIWSEEQIAGWKKVTDAVHAKGSYIYLQLWALGRAARPAALKQENPDFPYVAPSPIPLSTSPDDVPRELTKDEIKQYVEWYGTAARNAVHGAGFDGVEIHAANGYLIDQFLQDVSNKRTDEYGGSIENRARFALEVLDSVVAAVGPRKTGIRLAPFNRYQDMGMKNPVPTFSYVIEQFKQKYPDLAYVHTVTPTAPLSALPEDKSVDPEFIYKLWSPRMVITTGGYERDSAIKVAEETNQLIGFGRAFLANPDLVYRLRENIPLNEPQLDTFYLPMNERGYTTYPFSEQFLKSQL
ncbi:NADH:flavin oxidoreductase/NADH oxidase [Polyporus arcularius HHB13444]|uniref:NADH:flavin oxidoreductase/NADH oxidase n=1 Tax=Polyporus arcularius HHB13444 TaxID=1314778 RepID=A0A5C3PTP8_9APHY|nr:NADH:flavin oxidoreductase/NADH oxidase [Polyporus arcularius HHB13444]